MRRVGPQAHPGVNAGWREKKSTPSDSRRNSLARRSSRASTWAKGHVTQTEGFALIPYSIGEIGTTWVARFPHPDRRRLGVKLARQGGNPGPSTQEEIPMKQYPTQLTSLATALVLSALSLAAQPSAGQVQGCFNLPGYGALQSAIAQATAAETSGLNNQMWATIVNRDGVVCAVAFSGVNRGAQWPGSRVISAQKANTANAFSLDASSNSNGSGQPSGLALSTANLYSAVQPGGSLFGLQASNPVNAFVAYDGPSSAYGTPGDPMVGEKIGGVNVFGGGLALYSGTKQIVGAVGVSGDTSCADHD